MAVLLLILVGFPLVVSLAPVLVGQAIQGRGPRAQLLVTLAIAAVAAAFGWWCLSSRVSGVPLSQGLEGAGLAAGLLVLLPAALYLQLGCRARPPLTGVVWLLSLIPLAIYMVVVALGISNLLDCAPGETCNWVS